MTPELQPKSGQLHQAGEFCSKFVIPRRPPASSLNSIPCNYHFINMFSTCLKSQHPLVPVA